MLTKHKAKGAPQVGYYGGVAVSEYRMKTGESQDRVDNAPQLVELTEFSKEELDIAFAVEVLESSVVGRRQLSAALVTWALHGNTTLAEHLLKTKLISQEACIDLEQHSVSRLKEAYRGTVDSSQSSLSGSSAITETLKRLDVSGRVAKLLGISVIISDVQSNKFRKHVSRYELIRKIGQGGLGTVWLARDLELQRYVALKELPNAQTANQEMLNRFRREAEITGRLEHPAIVPIYQLGKNVDNGQAFYVMRFLGKQTLRDAITEYHEHREEGEDVPMLLRHLLSAFITVCQAIGHAHSRKVIHRDLKPENIAIDSFGQVIVIDWGLAKILDDGMHGDSLADIGFSEIADSQHTLTGQVLGSPLYMAPEQAAGRLDEVNELTDIFGLGAILFAIITGSAPHEQTDESSRSSTTRKLLTLIASGPTPRASTLNAEVDPVLDAICAKAMAKQRYARYSSTTALVEDIQCWMAREPVSVYPERLTQRIGRWVQHHQRLSQLIAVVMIIAMVAVTTLTFATRQNYIATQEARFRELWSDEREIEIQLISAVKNLSGNTGFMSNLPPIQGIIDARSGSKNSEEEAVWTDRLEIIYEGLMQVNPHYLTITYIAVGSEDLQEMVRVERHAVGQGRIRRVPKNRLATLEMSPLFMAVSAMGPGDVKISLHEQLSIIDQKSNPHRIIAAIPIFDKESGNLFGIMAIEVNLIGQIQNILKGLGNPLGKIYITDATGKVLVTSSPAFGVEVVTYDLDVSERIVETAGFFSADVRKNRLSDEASFTAYRVQLDPTDPSCSLGIVQRLSSDF